MLEDNSGKMIWAVGAIAIAILLIVGAKTFFPTMADQVPIYIQTVTGDLSDSNGTVDSSSDSDFSYSDPDTDNDTISITWYSGNKENLIIPEYRKIGLVYYKITSIGNGVFAGRTLTSVDIPDSVKTIGMGAFNGDSNLKSLTLGSDVTSIGRGAFGYTALTSVDFPASLKSIDEAAFYQTPLSSISFKSPVDLGEAAFQSTKLTNVTLPTGSTYVTGSNGTFDSNVTVTIK